MSKLDPLYGRALALGCKPEYSEGMFGPAWRCGCDDNRHGCDQQCSDLTNDSLTREERKACQTR